MNPKNRVILMFLSVFLALSLIGCPKQPPDFTITTASLPEATEGQAYSAQLKAEGGTPPLKWSVSTGGLPEGLTLDAQSGAISGTTNAVGKARFTVMVADSASPALTASRSFDLTVKPPGDGPPKISTASPLRSGTVGQPYTPPVTLAATGGTEPLKWSGTPPAGLTLSQAGVLSGTPSAAGNNLSFNVTVTDSASPARSDTKSFQITIVPPPPKISTASPLPGATQGQAIAAITLAATGGTAPLRWSGTPPAGLTLSQGGVLSGTPSAAGNNLSFNVTVTDSASPARSDTKSFQITIGTVGPLPDTWSFVGVNNGQAWTVRKNGVLQPPATPQLTPVTVRVGDTVEWKVEALRHGLLFTSEAAAKAILNFQPGGELLQPAADCFAGFTWGTNNACGGRPAPTVLARAVVNATGSVRFTCEVHGDGVTGMTVTLNASSP